MGLGRVILTWMVTEDRALSYLADKTDLDVMRLVDLIVGDGAPETHELGALAAAVGVAEDDLRRAGTQHGAAAAPLEPLRCYTVGEVAAILQVSEDTVRKEIRTGALAHVLLGDRVIRIPRCALEARLARSPDVARGPVAGPGPPSRAKRASTPSEPRQLLLS